MKRKCFLVIIFLASVSSVAPAQSLSFDQTNYRNDSTRSVNRRAEFSFALFPSSVRIGSRSRPFGFSLMAAGSGSTSSALGLSPMAAGANLQVLGGGTLGRLTKWTGFTSSNSFIGNSTIFEDKNGLVGIGTDTPTSRLTVAGVIQSTSGGFRFPDGTVQTTSASGALFSVVHDTTLVGDGTAGSPLGVAVPLALSGGAVQGILHVTNTGDGGRGMTIQAGDGGPNSLGLGGSGLSVQAGAGIGNGAGTAVSATGGDSDSFGGGTAVRATGGRSDSGPSGDAVIATGGSSGDGFGGNGVLANGGDSVGAGSSAGDGIIARGGFGNNIATDGRAGLFNGNVEINGNLSVTGTKNFTIDHPLDPENKYLYHAAVESAEVLNIYSGNARLDAKGEAIVPLPEWFQAINRDFRYSLTPIGAPASGLYIAGEITNGHFKIAGGVAGMKVSWQVTGVRSDRALLKRPFQAEQEKPERERGTYLNPEAFDQPEERGVEWARHPELMRQIKARRVQMKRRNAN